MCGIAGIVNSKPSDRVSQETLISMANAIAHRGPDAEGIFISEDAVGLAHRRLSIIDLSNGNQPISNEDDSVHIIFNGEIYNHQRLRTSLIDRGHYFKTNSDTETILHLYEELGTSVVHELRGMFAFAIWDSKEKKLFLARDRFGQKPLYYSLNEKYLLFGSEIKSLLAADSIDRTLSTEALEDYLYYGFIPGSRSIYKNVHKLEAGGSLTLSTDTWTVKKERYWNIDFPNVSSKSVEDWQSCLSEKITETVDAHSIADVTVGAFLSGGLDSSLITAVAAQQSSTRLKTFSIGFNERKFSELDHAAVVATQFDTDHTESIVTADAINSLEQLIHHYDEPFADASAIPTMRVSELASRHVKVVLSGDGGDEAFGGYSRYAHDLWESKIRAKIPTPIRQLLINPMAQLYPKADWLPRYLRFKNTLQNLGSTPSSAYANTLCRCPSYMRRQLLVDSVNNQNRGYAPQSIVEKAFGSEETDVLNGMLRVDSAILLPDDFLTKVDRASMAFGLEVRPPLVDHELMQLAWTIPAALKVRQGQTKWILKKTAEKYLSNDIIYRRKQGFEIPIDQWLRGPLKPLFEREVLSSDAPIADFLNTKYAQKLFDKHCSRRGRLGELLWSLLVLGSWMRRYL